MKKRIVSIAELSEYLGTPKGTLYHWVSQRKIPYVKLGRSTRFDIAEIDGWLARRSFRPEIPQEEAACGDL